MTQELQPLTPASAFSEYMDETQNLGEGIIGGFPTINYRGKTWSLKFRGEKYPFLRSDDGTPLSYLDVIILGSSPFVSKSYYTPGEWNEDSSGAPLCTSIRGDAPDPGCPEPQSNSCATCPHNEWKTLRTGRRGKECQDQKRLALLLRPEMTTRMLGSPLDEPVFLKVPPNSLAPLKTYGDSLMHQGLPPVSVITRISFHATELFKMDFKAIRSLKNEEAPGVLPLIRDPRTSRILGLSPQFRSPALPAAKPQQVIAPPSPAVIQAELALGPVATAQAEMAAQIEARRAETLRKAQEAQKAAIRAAAERVAAPQQGNGGESEPTQAKPEQLQLWEESSDDLDKEVAAVLGKKIQDMMR